MINRPLIAVIFLISSISIGMFSLFFTEKKCGETIETLNETAYVINKKNTEEIEKSLSKSVEKWESVRPILNLICGQGETNEIRSELNKAIFFANIGDYQTSLLYIEECKADINKIIASNEPTITTIF